jgi:hypothetical protein
MLFPQQYSKGMLSKVECKHIIHLKIESLEFQIMCFFQLIYLMTLKNLHPSFISIYFYFKIILLQSFLEILHLCYLFIIIISLHYLIKLTDLYYHKYFEYYFKIFVYFTLKFHYQTRRFSK